MTGTIKFYQSGQNKPFGFIYGEDGEEFYFNSTNLMDKERYPKAGDKVRFEKQDTPRGQAAIDVEILI